MKKTDKTLIAIVVGIVLLVVSALAATLMKPEPSYLAEDSPASVAHNYLLAVQLEDYERARSYLDQALPGIPRSEEEFHQAVRDRSWIFRLDTNVNLEVKGTQFYDSGNTAVVTVREDRILGSGIFDSGQSTVIFEMSLRRVGDRWKVTDSDYYFDPCWSEHNSCP